MTPPVEGCAYFLDLDGTLVALAETPSRAAPGLAVRRLIASLHLASGGALALITGRSLADLDRIFPAGHLPAAGQHGLERRRPDGHVVTHRASLRPLNAARRVLADLEARHPRLLLEDKGLSLALHYRRAPHLASVAHRVMGALRTALGPRYALQHGKRVVELTPAGRDKGKAIAAFMREAPFRGRTPLFIGDDITDEDGFARVNRLGGYSVKVGAGRTTAGWRLPDVRAVLNWLERGTPMPVRTHRTRRRRPASPRRAR